MIDWLSLGYELAFLLFSTAFTLVCGALFYRKYVAPSILEEMQKASETITNVAKLAGLKSQEYTGAKNIEKSVARDLINNKIPELEAVKVFVSPDTWEEIQDNIDNHPEAILQLWQKYGHYFTGVEAKKEQEYMFL